MTSPPDKQEPTGAERGWNRAASRRYGFGLLGGLLAAAGVWSGLVAFQAGGPTESSRWTYRILQQKLARTGDGEGPRLVFLGGSNVVFGIRARTIEERTGILTLNFGSHVGLGRRYLISQFRQALQPGDTAVLCLEYELYQPDELNEIFIDYLFSRDPGYLARLDPLQQARAVFGLAPARLLEGCANRLRPPARSSQGYDERKVNAWGDETVNNEPQSEKDRERVAAFTGVPFLVTGRRMCPEAEADLLAFRDWCRERGVALYATFPNTLDSPEYRGAPAQQALDALTDWYRQQGIPVLGRPDDGFFPADAMYDTNYHLKGPAADKRTARMMRAMEEAGLTAKLRQPAARQVHSTPGG